MQLQVLLHVHAGVHRPPCCSRVQCWTRKTDLGIALAHLHLSFLHQALRTWSPHPERVGGRTAPAGPHVSCLFVIAFHVQAHYALLSLVRC